MDKIIYIEHRKEPEDNFLRVGEKDRTGTEWACWEEGDGRWESYVLNYSKNKMTHIGSFQAGTDWREKETAALSFYSLKLLLKSKFVVFLVMRIDRIRSGRPGTRKHSLALLEARKARREVWFWFHCGLLNEHLCLKIGIETPRWHLDTWLNFWTDKFIFFLYPLPLLSGVSPLRRPEISKLMVAYVPQPLLSTQKLSACSPLNPTYESIIIFSLKLNTLLSVNLFF